MDVFGGSAQATNMSPNKSASSPPFDVLVTSFCSFEGGSSSSRVGIVDTEFSLGDVLSGASSCIKRNEKSLKLSC
ncbi:hypothetical protein DPMN_135502 [Dreissena polymorpha]|uniref:Uncharacterized protein n=1 Tax=Dreissena polymorpha TaxID=45954 RepID=A0A9D4JCW7_DREPO|nr:hypothetical protein DPMN_135502 [Dreissena polymorpha]